MSVNRAALPAPLYTAEQTRVLDRTAIEQFSIPGIRLMQRAGHAVFAEILDRYPQLNSLTVLCGGGNNGGDGFVIAQLARQKELKVQLVCVGDKDFVGRLQGEAKDAWQQLQEVDSNYELYRPDIPFTGELLVDALLGTGLSGNVRGAFAEAIEQINLSGKPVVAVDTPSGLCADTGRVLGNAVKADMTLSFIGLKRGLFTSEAVDYCGELLFDDLKVPDEVYDQIPVDVFRTTQEDLARFLSPRAQSSHKGIFGHVLVIGGNKGMGGAALLAAESALRCGAGLVSLATREEHVTASLSRCPEVMVHAVENVGKLAPLLDKTDVVVIGPGLGQSAWSGQMLLEALKSDKPLVLDADALNLMASKGYLNSYKRDNWICTPHPGEAARLLGRSITDVQLDRFASVRMLQNLCGGAVVLKGAGSLSCAGGVVHLCDKGNPGMAVGGMGDVLSGICGAFLAQGLVPEHATRLAVYVHALSADKVTQEQGEIGLFASDLCRVLPKVINCKYE
ncbi:NAD(P)H-hydrate dehydratase [Neptuniibacter sp.]|uniref:NAD(P)H-hydrate dehydratase n=1 Tax=Neptuniibacter sp. TaxID=1962643 RepID=UPI002608D686|nr:NAD(P)H-hydrate dehydratase [Neptuniibacter sp.]MCP4597439.1 NAD(P)H-hydrate dehydratase [Neptuniibacter sp.]